VTFSELITIPGRFLVLGNCEKELTQLIENKWCGIAVLPPNTWGSNSLPDEEYYGDVQYIEAHLSNDSHFTRLMQGYWIKPLTVRDIFDAYGAARFDLIIIDVPMMTRNLWYSDQVQVHMPKCHLIREDGHNEAVIKKAHELGYASRVIEGEWLLIAK
jgi:hypothetical protein